ncbi:hypothetical protein CNMCM5793_000590 [Aspergillus hiratsukae]|uniref:Zn(2)-C6 fungal-type domain-containing protein n=1 Tax=Aspergillus hiratsukae TaxID=1194566 RepID=A0A8H6UWT1_9EURO|nr:hypothetical protein CNMCM5793_000590 [Aspergillus hiratsukae]KAF7169752.1 hypothetical protein CNMCM6106_004542 [Aspergillus hiratsukae]
MDHPSISHTRSDSSIRSLPSSTQWSAVWPLAPTTPPHRRESALHFSAKIFNGSRRETMHQTHRIGVKIEAHFGQPPIRSSSAAPAKPPLVQFNECVEAEEVLFDYQFEDYEAARGGGGRIAVAIEDEWSRTSGCGRRTSLGGIAMRTVYGHLGQDGYHKFVHQALDIREEDTSFLWSIGRVHASQGYFSSNILLEVYDEINIRDRGENIHSNVSRCHGDLRDRRRRRCIKTADQERTSKRKSCETCAQKKVRCSTTPPACGRCVQTRTPCHYPPTSVPANPAAAAAAAAGREDNQDSNNHDRSIPKAPSSCLVAATPLADTPATLPTLSEVDFPHLQHCQSHPQEALDPLLAPWSPMLTSTNIHQMLHPFADSTLFARHDLCAVDSLPWVDDLSPLSEHFSPDATLDAAWLPPPLMPLHKLSKNPLIGQSVGRRTTQSVEDEPPQLSEQLTFGQDFLPPSGKLSSREAKDAAPAAADG